jgi:hypothetical protein
MPQGQALSGSRSPAFAYDPRDLTLVVDPGDSLYDKRVHLPVSREDVVDVAIRGVHTPPSVRRRGSESVVVMGRQRTKRAIIANALGAGQLYKGPVKAVIDAIREMGSDADFVARISLLMKGRPIKVRVVAANHGDDGAVRMMMRSENARRVGDVMADRIAAAREDSEKYGSTPEDIAAAEGVSVATVKRWLARDPNAAPKEKSKGRGKSRRPGIEVMTAMIKAEAVAHLSAKEKAMLGFCAGTVPLDEFASFFPALAHAATATVVNAGIRAINGELSKGLRLPTVKKVRAWP